MRRLKRLVDYRKALMQYYTNYYSTSNIFRLQQVMLEKGICPRCGTSSRSWASDRGHFPCWECGFWITPNEVQTVIDDYGKISIATQKRILKKRLKGRIKKDEI
jgi:hypothetical protein